MAVMYTDTSVGRGDAPDSHSPEASDGYEHASNPYYVVFALAHNWQACDVYPFKIEYVSAVN
jgi:hypothetical protein